MLCELLLVNLGPCFIDSLFYDGCDTEALVGVRCAEIKPEVTDHSLSTLPLCICKLKTLHLLIQWTNLPRIYLCSSSSVISSLRPFDFSTQFYFRVDFFLERGVISIPGLRSLFLKVSGV